jgi:hypothetical protein
VQRGEGEVQGEEEQEDEVEEDEEGEREEETERVLAVGEKKADIRDCFLGD